MKHVQIRQAIEMQLEDGPAEFHTFHGLPRDKEHLALGLGNWRSQLVPLVRIHSECLTGDVFASSRCDCGDQLAESMRLIRTHGGILIYLRQEGRGIGLYNKLDAYRLQKQGHDTYEANKILGFLPDERNYEAAASILKALGKNRIRLLSNNPDKCAQLVAFGISVEEMVPTGVYLKTDNRSYLKAKFVITGHTLRLDVEGTPS